MGKKVLSVKDSSLAFVVGFFLMQIFVVILYLIVASLNGIFGWNIDSLTSLTSNCYGYLLCTIAMDLALVIIFIFFKKTREGINVISKPSGKKILLYILIGCALFFCLYPIVDCFDYWLMSVGVEISEISYNLDLQGYLVSIVSLVLLPAICEELFFRGVLLQGLKRHGKIFSILLTAFMFMIFHMSLTQMIYPFLAGITLSLIMYHENNIIYSTIVHATNNFLSLTFSYLNISLSFNHWTYILLAVILLLVYICLIIFLLTKNLKLSPREKIENPNLFYLYLSLTIMILLWIITCFWS